MDQFRGCVIIYNVDGPEAFLSVESATELYSVLASTHSPTLLPVTTKCWENQVKLVHSEDLVVFAAHGGVGEDGTIQSYFEASGIAHTSSNHRTSSVLVDKHFTKLLYLSLGISTPLWYYKGREYGFNERGTGFVRKPLTGGGGIGLDFVGDYGGDGDAHDLLVEEYIPGTQEVCISVVGHNRVNVLPPIVKTRDFANLGKTERSGDNVCSEVVAYCEESARAIHEVGSCYGVTKTDFIVSVEGEVFAVETDAQPALGRQRSSAVAAAIAGFEYKDFVESVIEEPCRDG